MTPVLPEALLEAAIILAGAAFLWSHAGFRKTISATPRALRWTVSGVLTVWFVSQIAELESATYPFTSWHMYGESMHDAPIEGFRLRGVDCAGREHIVPWNGGVLGRRPHLALAIPRVYHEDQKAGPASTAVSTTDSLLLMILARWNQAPERAPLCELQLQRVQVPAARASVVPLPPYETVRTVTSR